VPNSITISRVSVSVTIDVDLTKFQTEGLHNTNMQRYCYISLISDLYYINGLLWFSMSEIAIS
jgi:hypothetical protein